LEHPAGTPNVFHTAGGGGEGAANMCSDLFPFFKTLRSMALNLAIIQTRPSSKICLQIRIDTNQPTFANTGKDYQLLEKKLRSHETFNPILSQIISIAMENVVYNKTMIITLIIPSLLTHVLFT
jgi:hypothetical protein